jgi:hypothetical protein
MPSGTTLRAAACPGLSLGRGKGAIFGRVQDAQDQTAIPGAVIALSWVDIGVDMDAKRVTSEQRNAAVVTDSLGHYRACGVPTEIGVLMQVQHQGRAGSAIDVSVPDDVGLAMRHFAFSANGSRSIDSLDSAAGTGTPPLAGRASLSGTVRSSTGQPVSDAQVRVAEAAPVTRTDSMGRYTLSGLPAGTQLLDVRRIGFLLARVPVPLRDDASRTQDVTLTQIVSLDSVRVIARRSLYPRFEESARRNAFGRFLREADIERRNAHQTSDLVRDASFRVEGFGVDARVVSSRGAISLRSSACVTNIVIDGMQHQEINLVHPQDIGAMEIYRGSAGAPPQYDSACGVIVIWTKR